MQEKYSATIEDRKSDVREYNDWLSQECEDEIKIHKISLSEMPQDETVDYKALWDACILLIEKE
ncbi:MAG: hypothetical protein IPH20_11735 [Bacteroidales bacterium]|nr:hypothetical protein [Bacteroidales bacterium]